MGRQKSLGLITVLSNGTPQHISAVDVYCESYMVEPWHANTGKIYIGISSTVFRAGTANCIGYCPVPTANVVSVFSSGKGANGAASFNLKDLYLDSDVNGEGAVISYTA